jgi:hypothetical protein
MMPILRHASIGVLLVALLAMIFGKLQTPEQLPKLERGANDDTILFFCLAESGQMNVELATAQALMEKHPDFKIHFASFPSVRDKVQRISSFARHRNPSVQEIVFHEIPGPDRLAAMQRQMNCTGPFDCLAHPPGVRGLDRLAQQLELALWPWSGEEHIAIYERSIDIIKEVEPVAVVIDFAFRPPLDAVERLNRLHAIISPLALADIFALQQPYGAGFWKYPALVCLLLLNNIQSH